MCRFGLIRVSFPSVAVVGVLADSDLVSAVGWTQTNVLYSCSDDNTIMSWNIDGEAQSKVCDIDVYSTDFHWLTAPGATESEVFGLAACDGMQS